MTSITSQQLHTSVAEFLQEHFDIAADKLSDNPTLQELGLDSIMMMHILMDLEDSIGVKIVDFSMPAKPRIDDVVNLIERNLAAEKKSNHG